MDVGIKRDRFTGDFYIKRTSIEGSVKNCLYSVYNKVPLDGFIVLKCSMHGVFCIKRVRCRESLYIIRYFHYKDICLERLMILRNNSQ